MYELKLVPKDPALTAQYPSPKTKGALWDLCPSSSLGHVGEGGKSLGIQAHLRTDRQPEGPAHPGHWMPSSEKPYGSHVKCGTAHGERV